MLPPSRRIASPRRSDTVAKWLVLVVGLCVGAVLGGVVVFVRTDDFRFGGRAHVDLSSWAHPDDDWGRSMMPGAHWATDQLCGPDIPCSQAVQSDTLTMYRFADRDDAVATARYFAGEGYVSGWVVVRFEPGGLTPAQRREFVGVLDCINVGVAEGGLEC
jgi:hypothetical protein